MRTQHIRNLFQPCRNFFLLIGPGFPAFGFETGTSMLATFRSGTQASGGRFGSVGDGVNSISIQTIQDCLTKFAQNLNEPYCIFVAGHGRLDQDKFFLKLANDTWIANEEILFLFTLPTITAPQLIFYAACSSNAATKHVNILPRGTLVIGISDIVASGNDLERWMTALNTNWPTETSTASVLHVYLFRALKNRFSPSIAVANIERFNLNDVFRSAIGSEISQHVLENMKRTYDLTDDINRVAQAIATGRNEWSVDTIDYGTALALCLEQFFH